MKEPPKLSFYSGSISVPIDPDVNGNMLPGKVLPPHRSRSNDECCSLLIEDDDANEDSTLPCCNRRRWRADVSCDGNRQDDVDSPPPPSPPPSSPSDSGRTRLTPNSLTRLAAAWLWTSGIGSRTMDRPPLPLGCTFTGGGPVAGERKKRSCPPIALGLATLYP